MRPLSKYLSLSNEFWADIKFISERSGYSKSKELIIPSIETIAAIYKKSKFDISKIFIGDHITDYGQLLLSYLKDRAYGLNSLAPKLLMTKEEAKTEYEKLLSIRSYSCPQPMNKQKGNKRAKSYFTCMINMLIETEINSIPCNYDPKNLLIFTDQNKPFYVLSRRVDGAFPTIIDPISIWEIKEYYNTTTFGSRVADGIYETLLDGLEINEMQKVSNRKIFHYLFIDDFNTWWNMGKSYLCRIFDLIHMGLVDEVIFGREIFKDIPRITKIWEEEYIIRNH